MKSGSAPVEVMPREGPPNCIIIKLKFLLASSYEIEVFGGKKLS
jgi:hypothetical protein